MIADRPLQSLERALEHHHRYWHSGGRVDHCPEQSCVDGTKGLQELRAVGRPLRSLVVRQGRARARIAFVGSPRLVGTLVDDMLDLRDTGLDVRESTEHNPTAT